MSKEDLVPTLALSPSGPIRPKKRPPLKINTSCNRLTEEEINGLLMKEASFYESTNNEQKAHEDEISNKTHLDDSDEETAEESDQANEFDSNCDDSDVESLQHELKETDDQGFTNTSNNKDVTDQCDKYPQKHKENIIGNTVFDIIPKSYQGMSIGGIVALLFLLCSYLYAVSSGNSNHTIDLNTIKNEFPTQNEDLWTAFEAGVQDVVSFSRPSTFIFLYKKECENTLENLLEQLTKYAVCKITHCSKKAITVTDTELNSSEIVEDYGRLIDRYKNKLEENGVMIIKHIENIQGISAQAFHSFCDEFSPLVDKSLFIFTMKVGKVDNQNEMNFVEEYFRNKWADIKTDTFNALITRITSMVLEIRP